MAYDPIKNRETQRRYREKNREKLASPAAKEWRKKWKAENPEKSREHPRRSRPAERCSMKKRKHDPAQIDLFDWAAKRPTAKVISAIPGIANRMWRERHMQQPHNPPHIVPRRRRA